MNRREFLATAAGAAAFSGCSSLLGAPRPEPKFVWSELIHLGMNEWHEIPQQQKWPNLTDPVLMKAVADEYNAADHVRFDEAVWARVSKKFADTGVNQVVIDLGEAVQYPSHPEIAVKGAWSPDKLRAELRRLRAMGIEPIPKLNFSATHDIWLGLYHRMVSTKKYYQVVADLIADVSEIFESPRFFHLGLDEETAAFQLKGQSVIVVRQGELWWHDVLFYIREVEKHGSRAWVWSDYLRHHPREDFVKRMPKSVVQSPWCYCNETRSPEKVQTKAVVALAELGYDTVPCSSNCYSYKDAMSTLVQFCRGKFDPQHLLGFQMAPWLEMNTIFEPRWCESADLLAAARKA